MSKLGQMIEDCGCVRDIAANSSCLNTWISEPQIELRGATTLEAMGTGEERQQVETLLKRMREGYKADLDASAPADLLVVRAVVSLLEAPSAASDANVDHVEVGVARLDVGHQGPQRFAAADPQTRRPLLPSPAYVRKMRLLTQPHNTRIEGLLPNVGSRDGTLLLVVEMGGLDAHSAVWCGLQVARFIPSIRG